MWSFDDEPVRKCPMCGAECDTTGSTVYCDKCGYEYELDGEDLVDPNDYEWEDD